MEYFLLKHDALPRFPYIRAFGMQRCRHIKPGTLHSHRNPGIEICYIYKGKYDWQVEGRNYRLYPGDAFVTCPWQRHGSPQGTLDIGILSWMIIAPKQFNPQGRLNAGSWCSLKQADQNTIGALLAGSRTHAFRCKAIGDILIEIHEELKSRDLGFEARVNQRVTDLLILVARNIAKSRVPAQKSLSNLMKVEKALLDQLDRSWTTREMAAILGLRPTAFIGKIKAMTGYTPSNYLVSLRLSKAKRLLTASSESITGIALRCGFYSSQHFSTAFRKWTGVSPRAFRRSKA